jgi:hypothetical protein
MSKANMGLQDRKVEVNLCFTKYANTPLQIMVIELLVEVV